MEVSRPNSAKFTTGTGLVAVALLLVGTWSPQAFSASWSKSDCPESSDEIQPEMTLDGLTLDPVDHSAIEPTHTDIDEAAIAAATKEQFTLAGMVGQHRNPQWLEVVPLLRIVSVAGR